MIFKLLLVVAVKPDLSNRRPTGVFFAVQNGQKHMWSALH